MQFQFTSLNLCFFLRIQSPKSSISTLDLGLSSLTPLEVAHGAGAGPGGGWQTLAQVLRQGKVLYINIYIYTYTVNPLDISQETSLTYQNWLRTHKLFPHEWIHGSLRLGISGDDSRFHGFYWKRIHLSE